jgi:N-acetylmuramoyl-L-alanine amidase
MPKICLDAGHFANYNYNDNVTPRYWESRMAWKLHLLLKTELEKYGFTVIVTRDDEEKDLGLMARGQKSKGCDLFLSLHSNACNTESVDRAVVIYPVSNAKIDLAQQLAQTVTDTMGLHDKPQIYNMWNSAHNADYYGVIRGAASVGVAGLIIEHSFHTNNRAAAWLNQNANLKTLAMAEAKTLAEYFGMDIPQHPFVDVPDGKFYTDAVKWAWSEGIVDGVDATHFKPNANVTRGQIVTMLKRYHDKYGGG